jgi:membrane-anchored protein YejM (alkaline phosphatase superfamily)
VHWGIPLHYTRGIAGIDDGIRRLVEQVEAIEEYRDNTVFAIIPDCGRDANHLVSVPFQNHSNTKSSHEIFGLFVGPGVARGQVVTRSTDQISVASTLGSLMNMTTDEVEGPALEEVFT